jgi:oligosaccharide repeat unit polymerase
MNKQGGRANGAATTVILCGLAVTMVFLPSDGVVNIFTVAAVGIGLTLISATAIEATVGVRNLIRVDLLILWVLYGLTLLEFLFPQPDVETSLSPHVATSGTHAVFLGFAGIVVGRHLVPGRPQLRLGLTLQPAHLFRFFLIAALLGYLHILLAVSFDPFEMLYQMSLPRFWQSWGRGKYGDMYSLLYELNLLIYLLPPMAGLICARASEYKLIQKIIVTLVLTITFYYAFSSGTRNVIVTYVIAFAGAYFLTKPRIKLGRTLLLGVPTLALLLIATTYMLEFRGVGLSNFSSKERQYDTLFIDHNIVNLSQLTQVFPASIEFLGLEVPFIAIVKPIPRFLWSGKPEGLSTSIESALGSYDGVTTLSCTFIGEAYMAGGLFAVLLTSLLFGAAAEMWNRVGRDINSSFAQALYASGFLCAAMAMRSMLSMVPFMLPTIALWLYGKLWLPRSSLHRSTPIVEPNNR